MNSGSGQGFIGQIKLGHGHTLGSSERGLHSPNFTREQGSVARKIVFLLVMKESCLTPTGTVRYCFGGSVLPEPVNAVNYFPYYFKHLRMVTNLPMLKHNK